MNKEHTYKDAVEELESSQGIEILPDRNEEREFKKLMAKMHNTKSEVLKDLNRMGYSEFMMGVMLGIILKDEEYESKMKGFMGRFLGR